MVSLSPQCVLKEQMLGDHGSLQIIFALEICIFCSHSSVPPSNPVLLLKFSSLRGGKCILDFYFPCLFQFTDDIAIGIKSSKDA